MSIGSRIKKVRKELGLTQKQVSELTGIDRKTVSSYEVDSRKPTADGIVILAKVLHTTTDYLLGNDDRYFIDTTDLNDITIEKILLLIKNYLDNK